MFGKTMVQGLMAVAVAVSACEAKAGELTYNIVDYPVYETDNSSGTDTISGTIITDGKIGNLSQSDILGGSFTFYNPVVGAVIIPDLNAAYSLAGVVTASSSAITIPAPPADSFGDLILGNASFAPNSGYLEYGRYGSNVSVNGNSTDYYEAVFGGNIGFYNADYTPPGLDLGDTSMWSSPPFPNPPPLRSSVRHCSDWAWFICGGVA